MVAGFGLLSLTVAGAAALDPGVRTAIAGGELAADGEPRGFIGSLLGAVIDAAGTDEASEEIHLRVPPLEPLLAPAPSYRPAEPAQGALRAHAYQFVSPIFSRPSTRPRAVGFVRRGIVLRALDRVSGPGCKGVWYAVDPKGVLCSSEGFAISSEPRPAVDQRMPDVASATPYVYAKVTTPGALRFFRIPTLDEEAEIARALERDQRLPDVVEQRLDGIYLLAIDREERAGDRRFVRTVRGRYLRARDVELKPVPRMRGELLAEGGGLPYAFVYGREASQAPVYHFEPSDAATRRVGVADNHARLRVARELTVGDQVLVVGPKGLALSRADVRIARRIERPAEIPAGAKWIHVDLREQALVAYEGDRPVFATLVSSGKGEAYATPQGLYRVGEKHISTTMRGPDPDEGVYEVGEVPWTMFYKDSYALHGAYWHDNFGRTRSHGCTNIAPVDARWLFYWSDGELPPGWHALRNFQGTYVYLTGVAQDEEARALTDGST